MNIIFLDIDGVLISDRDLGLSKGSDKFKFAHVFSPFATDLISQLATDADATFVISSSWASLGKDVLFEHLQSQGIDTKRIHKDWNTPRRFTSSRIHNINMWLDDHPEITNYVIIDDDGSIRHNKRAILIDPKLGFNIYDYNKALDILGVN